MKMQHIVTACNKCVACYAQLYFLDIIRLMRVFPVHSCSAAKYIGTFHYSDLLIKKMLMLMLLLLMMMI